MSILEDTSACHTSVLFITFLSQDEIDGSSRSIGRNVEQGPFPVRIGEKSGLEFDFNKGTLEVFKGIISLDTSVSLKIEFICTFWGEDEIVDKVGEEDTIRDESRCCVSLEDVVWDVVVVVVVVILIRLVLAVILLVLSLSLLPLPLLQLLPLLPLPLALALLVFRRKAVVLLSTDWEWNLFKSVDRFDEDKEEEEEEEEKRNELLFRTNIGSPMSSCWSWLFVFWWYPGKNLKIST